MAFSRTTSKQWRCLHPSAHRIAAFCRMAGAHEYFLLLKCLNKETMCNLVHVLWGLHELQHLHWTLAVKPMLVWGVPTDSLRQGPRIECFRTMKWPRSKLFYVSHCTVQEVASRPAETIWDDLGCWANETNPCIGSFHGMLRTLEDALCISDSWATQAMRFEGFLWLKIYEYNII